MTESAWNFQQERVSVGRSIDPDVREIKTLRYTSIPRFSEITSDTLHAALKIFIVQPFSTITSLARFANLYNAPSNDTNGILKMNIHFLENVKRFAVFVKIKDTCNTWSYLTIHVLLLGQQSGDVTNRRSNLWSSSCLQGHVQNCQGILIPP